jgi:hypothetical protein
MKVLNDLRQNESSDQIYSTIFFIKSYQKCIRKSFWIQNNNRKHEKSIIL